LFWAGKGGWDEIRESQSAEFRRVAGVCAAGGVK
jgi:hypothetical protein